MKYSFLFSYILVLSYIYSSYLGKNQNGIDIFKIDLDLPPEDRFVTVAKYFKTDVIKVFKKYFPFPLSYLVKLIGNLFWNLKPENYLEMEGLGKEFEIDPKILLASQYIYDLSAFCTSVVSYDKNNTIIHGRNLDFLFAPEMRNITYQAHFYKNNSEIFRAIMFAPLNTVFTAWKNNAFSISLNERKPSYRKNPLILIDNIIRIFKGEISVGNLIRQTFEMCDDYNCAFEKLKSTKQIAASYYTIAGINKYEGAIISKSASGPDHIEFLDENKWYIVQTNDDHWKGICNIRCSYVKDSLEYIGHDDFVSEDLFEILKKWPSNNVHSIYYSLMIPAKETFQSCLLDGDKPAPNVDDF